MRADLAAAGTTCWTDTSASFPGPATTEQVEVASETGQACAVRHMRSAAQRRSADLIGMACKPVSRRLDREA